MPVPAEPKIYHIVHVDRLPSIIADGCLWCDVEILRRSLYGVTIGIHSIKQRRLANRLDSRPGLCVGECVPFYFCPRSVMLYVIFQGNNPELNYRGGQDPIVHLEADLRQAVAWADGDGRRWPSPSRTPAPITSWIDATWRNWTRSTGMLYKPGDGAARTLIHRSRNTSRQSS